MKWAMRSGSATTPFLSKANRLLDEGKLVSEIAETFGVHVATIDRLGAAQ